MRKVLMVGVAFLSLVACDKLEKKRTQNPVGPTPTTPEKKSTLRKIDLAKGTIKKLAAGETHTCALYGDGAPMCWGKNDRGQLGLDPTTVKSSKNPIAPDQKLKLTDIAAGRAVTCGIADDGKASVLCWGSNVYSELGLDAVGKNESFAPVAIKRDGTKALEGAKEIHAAYGRVCAVTNTEILCWGKAHHVSAKARTTDTSSNGFFDIFKSAPAVDAEKVRKFEWLETAEMKQPVELNTSSLEQEKWGPAWTPNLFSSLTLLEYETCALVEKKIRCLKVPAGQEDYNSLHGSGDKIYMGRNDGSREGENLWEANVVTKPTGLDIDQVQGLPTAKIEHMAVGHRHACVAMEKQNVRCFGSNDFGQLGYIGDRAEGVSSEVKIKDVVLMSAGYRYTCALTKSDEVSCWGEEPL